MPGESFEKVLEDQRATSLKELHEKIDKFESGDGSVVEFHRMTPLKGPTTILTAASDSCAGRNSINRYLKATGMRAMEVAAAKQLYFSAIEQQTLFTESIMMLPVKVPGKGKGLGPEDDAVKYITVQVIDGPDDRARNFPIKFNQGALFQIEGVKGWGLGPGSGMKGDDDALLFLGQNVPSCGAAFELFPFPARKECYDEGITLFYKKGQADFPSQNLLLEKLYDGIVRIVFKKISNGQTRILYGTKHEARIPKSKRANKKEKPSTADAGESDDETAATTAGSGGAGKLDSWIRVFDVEIFEWRSFRFENVTEIAFKRDIY